MQMENEYHQQGFRLIAGVDEAGRGPLAGPVFAAACILPECFDLPGLDDSKKLTEKKREYLAAKIKEQAVAFSVASATSEEIDSLNILQATKLAMKRAVDLLSVIPDIVLVDGRDRINIALSHQPIVGGDGLCASIAAASILAKVTRDEFMCEMHEIYPEYCFDQHKGYGTKMHLEAIKVFGPCPIHRQSFSPIKEILLTTASKLG
jgi:ribonuclease HII